MAPWHTVRNSHHIHVPAALAQPADLCKRRRIRADGATREDALEQLSAMDERDATDEQLDHATRGQAGRGECGGVGDGFGVEDDDVSLCVGQRWAARLMLETAVGVRLRRETTA